MKHLCRLFLWLLATCGIALVAAAILLGLICKGPSVHLRERFVATAAASPLGYDVLSLYLPGEVETTAQRGSRNVMVPVQAPESDAAPAEGLSAAMLDLLDILRMGDRTP